MKRGDQAILTLPRAFQDRVELARAHPALTFEGKSLSYGQLDERSNRLAHLLRDLGVGPEARVGLCMERTPDLVVAILAILKAGGAYVPLDPAYPLERLAFMVRDSALATVITQGESATIATDAVKQAGMGSRIVDLGLDEALACPVEPLGEGAQPHNAAYVIYTSGSTGRPKGVVVTHANVFRLFTSTDPLYGFNEADVWTLFHSYAFDFSVWEIWGALLYGGRLVIIPHAVSRSPETFHRLLESEGVTVLNQTPSAFYQLMGADAARGDTRLALRYVIFGGEALELARLRPWFERRGDERPRLVNMYGITETTVHVTYRPIRLADLGAGTGSLIGEPLADLSLHILDEALKPVGPEVVGEMFVGGAGVARGYLNRDELTAARFIPDPFGEGRLYRTGDLARRRADGELEYLGRIDTQVKVRGFRIEVGEIENVLIEAGGLLEAAVAARPGPSGEMRLVAYVVAKPGDVPAVLALRKSCEERLPDYMVPSAYVRLAALPLTENGKLDRGALPEPTRERPELSKPYAAPHDPDEARVCDAFAAVLGLESVGRLDNFFELGGSSLLVIQAQVRLQDAFGREVRTTLFFSNPTPAAIAAALGKGRAAVGPARRARKHAAAPDQAGREAIAIIAMSGRFPGAASVEAFWENLRAGKETITYFGRDQLDPAIPAALVDDPCYVRARGVIEGVELFDAAFFGIAPREADAMDPQQRLFMELCWECLERGGYVPDACPAPVGVFGGMYNASYYQHHVARHPERIAQLGELAVMLANEKDFIATRTANRLNLTGPAISVHTACSTSLVAIAQAMEALRSGQCEMALAGGATVQCPPSSGYLAQEGAMLSPDGHTRTFDAAALGTVFSDGAAVVLLKRLADAIEDGDPVHAVIRGAFVNNDGGAKASFTAPSVDGQAAVITGALEDAGVDARSIGYVEAHGTATPLGDPVELEALAKAYRRQTPDAGFCRIGSVKSNVGHLVIAAGATGVIKAALALEHEQIPPTLHFQAPNPKLQIGTTPFVVNDLLTSWPRSDAPRRAGVSSFGIGGTNAHAILEEAPSREPSEPAAGPQLLVASARTPTALQAALGQLARHLEANPGVNLADVAHTLGTGRKAFTERACVVASTVTEALAALREPDSPYRAAGTLRAQEPAVALLFPGQGAQYARMGSTLYATEPAFREAFDACLEAARDVLRFDLRERVFSGDASGLTATEVTQPALFCVEYALAMYWLRLGVRPKALIGHSVGEFVAATLAGVFPLESALRLVALRAQLMQSMPPGSMLAVRAPAADVLQRLPAALSLAAENAPALCVVAGPTPAVEAFQAELERSNVVAKRLQTSHAFHSSMMDPAVAPFEAEVRRMTLGAPAIPIYSTVTGTLLTEQDARDPAYWARHMRAPVRFSPALNALLDQTSGVLVEAGPRATLATLARQHATRARPAPASVASLGDDAAKERDVLRLAAGRLWTLGVPFEHEALDTRTRKRRVTLPTYPFERKRHWLEAVPAAIAAAPHAPAPEAARPAAIPFPANAPMESPMSASPVQPSSQPSRVPALAGQVRTLLEDITGIEIAEADNATALVELGLDSLSLTQIAIQLKQTFKVNLTFRQLMEQYRSVDALAAFLDSKLPAAAPAPAAPVPAALPGGISMATPPIPVAPAAPGAAPSSMLEQVIQQQMQLMAQQIALLQGLGPASAAVPASAPAPTPPPSAAAPAEPAAANEDDAAAGAAKYDVKKAFGAIARIHTDATQITERQRSRLDAFMRRYVARTRLSKEYNARHRAHLADPRVVNGFRPALKEIIYQIVVERSKGAHVWDLDGNQYVDVLSGFGMNMFGWQPDFVRDAVLAQIASGYEIGPQHPLAGDVARMICELTGFDRAGLCNTGSEAVMGAMRIARTVTGRSTIALFTGSYHGIFDEVIVRATRKLRAVPAAPGIMASSAQNVLVLDYGTPESMEIIKARASELAAVLVEPVQSRRPDFQPREYLHELREVTAKAGTVLILDEVVTGFRSHPGGVQALFDLKADICTYGKVLGGGFPIGVIAGKREFMDALDGGGWQYGDDSIPTVGVTYFAGTFVRHPLALAAAKVVLDHLKAQGPALQAKLTANTEAMVAELNAFCREVGAPVVLKSFASVWKTFFTEDHPLQDLLFAMMRSRGIHILDNFPCFLTTAHEAVDIAAIKAAFRESVLELQESGFIPKRAAPQQALDASKPPVPGARLGKDPEGQPAWFVPHPDKPGKYLKLDA